MLKGVPVEEGGLDIAERNGASRSMDLGRSSGGRDGIMGMTGAPDLERRNFSCCLAELEAAAADAVAPGADDGGTVEKMPPKRGN